MRELVLERNDRRKQVVDALGMSFAKIKALRRIAAAPRTMRELAEELLTDRPYTTLLVDDLETRGLVARSVHPQDRRCKVVTVTEEGAQVAAKANRILGMPPEELQGLPAADLKRLDEILARLS
ncbi:MarR family transcriptional regulator [Amycolatopsis sp. K13G38]|uniref:MarR family transcriptional regulator n=2 Tax=Amycolatopsis acididurans TaxID=2724524 RepID=A0ABX1J4R0_9PSEU|nr:MarR family transcriptional regulator [Amycolatopsis acididurans]